ncbi:hypothetical protein [Candidatus Vidania fulgoroideorum]
MRNLFIKIEKNNYFYFFKKKFYKIKNIKEMFLILFKNYNLVKRLFIIYKIKSYYYNSIMCFINMLNIFKTKHLILIKIKFL